MILLVLKNLPTGYTTLIQLNNLALTWAEQFQLQYNQNHGWDGIIPNFSLIRFTTFLSLRVLETSYGHGAGVAKFSVRSLCY